VAATMVPECRENRRQHNTVLLRKTEHRRDREVFRIASTRKPALHVIPTARLGFDCHGGVRLSGGPQLQSHGESGTTPNNRSRVHSR